MELYLQYLPNVLIVPDGIADNSYDLRQIYNLLFQEKSAVNDDFDYSELDKPWDLNEKALEPISQDASIVTKCQPSATNRSTELLENLDRGSDMEDEKLSNLNDTEAVSLDCERIATRHGNDEFSENSVMEIELSAEAAVERKSAESEIELNSGLLLKKSDSCSRNDKEVSENIRRKPRICPGHERALPIEELVQELDMKEEGDDIIFYNYCNYID